MLSASLASSDVHLAVRTQASEITSPELYAKRRQFLKNSALFLATRGALGTGLTALSSLGSADPPASLPLRPRRGDKEWKF
jgi:hypothetical protein